MSKRLNIIIVKLNFPRKKRFSSYFKCILYTSHAGICFRSEQTNHVPLPYANNQFNFYTNFQFLEAIEVCKRLFVNDELKSRQQILILITDFHFEGSNTQKDRLLVKESLTTLQQLIGGTLEVYGVGVGGYFNRTVMDEILAAGNKDGHSGCGKNVEEWYEYLNKVNMLPIKGRICSHWIPNTRKWCMCRSVKVCVMCVCVCVCFMLHIIKAWAQVFVMFIILTEL